MNFSITPEQEEYIQSEVAAGNYADASAYIRQAISEKIKRDRLRDEKLGDLKAAIDEGFNSGSSKPLDIEAIIREAEGEDEARQAG